jgi:hypothetical protein
VASVAKLFVVFVACLDLFLGGCASPSRPIPTDRAIFAGRTYAFGAVKDNPGARASVVEIRRSGPREDTSIFLVWRRGRLEMDVLEAGRRVTRAPTNEEVEEAAALLSPKNPGYRDGLERWLARRVDLKALRRALAAEVEARRPAGQGLLGDLADIYRDERSAIEVREADARRRNTFFAGLFGWQRGTFSGYSWSFPFHVERYDRSEEIREVVVFPLLSGGRSERGGVEVLSVPLLAYWGRIDSPIDRAGGTIFLGTGRFFRESIAGRSTVTIALPLLAMHERSTGEDVAADAGRVLAGVRSSTHLLGSLVHWSREKPGIYKDRGVLRSVGRDRLSWRVLPLASHASDERGCETMIWPLLGFGWGQHDGDKFVRLFYFWKIG